MIIKTTKAIPLFEYMTYKMFNHKDGYYTTNNQFNGENPIDYITASTASQLFAEVLAVYLINIYNNSTLMQNKKIICLLEFGPGDLSLTIDLLRIFLQLNIELLMKIELHLVEISPVLRSIQQNKLIDFCKKHNLKNIPVFFYKDISEFKSKDPILLLANEFFDALPISQFILDENGWSEVCFLADEKKLIRTKIDLVTLYKVQNIIERRLYKDLVTGSVIEYSPIIETIVVKICDIISVNGGFGLIIDYGYEKNNFQTTLRFIKNHKMSMINLFNGDFDISAEVDFGLILDLISKYSRINANLNNQCDFLIKFGIMQRAQFLIDKNKSKRYEVINQLNFLTKKMKMFKILEINCLI